MARIHFLFNDRLVEVDMPVGTVTLDWIRGQQAAGGTREGCREGECGACTVLVGDLAARASDSEGVLCYRAVASCLLPIGELEGRHLVTIEGVNQPDILNPVQQAFVDEGATQCGFCTPGFIMSLSGFFLNSTDLSFSDAIEAVDGNICRCTGYAAIRRAIKNLCDAFQQKLDPKKPRIPQLLEWGILPPYFAEISRKLKTLSEDGEAEAASRKPQGERILVAGATDLFIQKPDELCSDCLDFASRHPLWQKVESEGGKLCIGGAVPVEDLRRSPVLGDVMPGHREILNRVSSTLMRNRATIAGNIVNASPIGDLSILLLALDAELELEKQETGDDTAGGSSTRCLPLGEFFLGYKKLAREKGELIRRICIPFPEEGLRFNFEKVAQRHYLDIASVNSAARFYISDNQFHQVRISCGGVAPIPLLLKKTMAALEGRPVEQSTLAMALAAMEEEIAPIDDVRGSKEYKRKLARSLVQAHFLECLPEIAGEEVSV